MEQFNWFKDEVVALQKVYQRYAVDKNLYGVQECRDKLVNLKFDYGNDTLTIARIASEEADWAYKTELARCTVERRKEKAGSAVESDNQAVVDAAPFKTAHLKSLKTFYEAKELYDDIKSLENTIASNIKILGQF